LRALTVILLGVGCGGGASTPPVDASGNNLSPADASPSDVLAALDAPAVLDAGGYAIEISKYPRGSESFAPLGNGARLPLLHGVQGFNLSEIELRVPASVPDNELLDLAYTISTSTDPPQHQTEPLPLLPAHGGQRVSGRYVIYMNQFTESVLIGAICHLTGSIATTPRGTLDLTVTLVRSSCVDTGSTVACPDGGVP
jgi:hypothetical protein